MTNNRSIEKLTSSSRSFIKYIIIKKDLDKNFYPNLPSNYGNKTQELYLGLIENKNKVLKEKLNVDYIASTQSLDLKRSYEDDEEDNYLFAETIEAEEEILKLEQKEIEMIKRSLEKNKGKRKAAADELGISERTLYRKIKQFDL